MQSKIKKYSSPFFFILGLVLFILVVRRLQVAELLNTLQSLGWQVIYTLLFPLTWYVCQTVAWFYVLEETGRHVSLFHLIKIRLIGEAVNTSTPVSFMGGDPVRIYMLQKKMPGALSAASIVLDRTLQSLAVIVLLLIGLMLAWHVLELPPKWKIFFPCLTLAMTFLLWFLIHRQQRGLFRFLSQFLSRLGFTKHLTESFQGKIHEMDQRISQFYRSNRGRFFTVLGFHFVARLMGVIEIYLIAYFLNIPLSAIQALFLASLSVLINMTFVFIPGSLGVMEGAYGALFHLMGLDPTGGVALQLVRRLRALFWVLVGLGLMIVYGKLKGRVRGDLSPSYDDSL